MDYKKKTDYELVDETLNTSARASVEMMRRLKNSTDFSSWVMIALTIILVVFTGVLIWQGFTQRSERTAVMHSNFARVVG